MNHEILERVWRLDAPRMRSHLARQHGRDVAEELVAEAITRLAAGADAEYEDARRLFARIALNAATDHARLARHGDVELTEIGGFTPFPSIEVALLRRDLLDAIRSLPSPEREAYTLTELRGLTVREAADVIGVHHTTVVRRAEAARTQLAKELT